MDDVAAARELEGILLGGPRRLTRREVAERSGVPVEEGRRLWRAMGFADVGDDEAVFTEGDVTALELLDRLRRTGVIDAEAAVAMTRSVGRSMARLADWQIDAYTEVMLNRYGDPTMDDGVDAAKALLPVMEQLLVHVWRRHLAAAAGRVLAAAPDELSTRTVAVGFADLVGFTGLTRRLTQPELGRLVDDFEARASDVVAERRGRVVKTVGDEVLFVADDPCDGAEIALALADTFADPLPPVRVGVAYGAVLSRLGDVYGVPVNIASRLTSRARPRTVLVDRELAGALAGAEEYELHRLRRFSVPGYDHLEASVLRWAGADAPD